MRVEQPSIDDVTHISGGAAALQSYADELAAHDAAVAAHNARMKRGETQVVSDAADAATANRGCPLGTLGWARAEGVKVCAPLCASDLDCTIGSRCRLLDEEDPRTAPPVVLAENHTQAELDGLVSARGTGEGALLVCDARWNAAPERVEQITAAAD